MRGKILVYILATVLLKGCSTRESSSSETVIVFDANNFGALPDDGKDDTPAMQAALDIIKKMNKPAILRFAGGTYDFFATSAVNANYPITAIHKQWDFVTPFHLDEIGDLTIQGGNSIFLMHGRMTPFVLNACENIKISRLSIEHERPSVFELKVVARDNYQVDYEAVSGDQFTIRGDSLIWMDANDNPQIPTICQQYDPVKDITWRGFDPLKDAIRIEKVNHNKIRVHYAPGSKLYGKIQPGRTFQFRWPIRNQCGVVVNQCQKVTFDSLNIYSWNGLGFVCQLSKDLTMSNLRMEPNPASGRTNAGFSDGIQIFACKGEILMENNRFVGMHDDHINIYGQLMRVDEIIDKKTLDVVYPGEETEGFMNFHIGDSIQFRDPETLATAGAFMVEGAELRNSKTQRLRLNGYIPLNSEGFWVENLTCIPKRVIIRGNYFGRVPTRSILMYTAHEAIIENNTFHRIPMATILMKCPDTSYGLQNHVENLTIRNNVFYECVAPLINSEPEVSILAQNADLYGTLEVKDNLVIMREIMPYFLDVRGFSKVVIGANRIELVNPHPKLANFNNCKEICLTPQIMLGVMEPPAVDLKNVTKHSGSGWKVEKKDSLPSLLMK